MAIVPERPNERHGPNRQQSQTMKAIIDDVFDPYDLLKYALGHHSPSDRHLYEVCRGASLISCSDFCLHALA